jgi:hypothetical protein
MYRLLDISRTPLAEQWTPIWTPENGDVASSQKINRGFGPMPLGPNLTIYPPSNHRNKKA